MKKFSYKDIEFQDIKELSFTVQFWLYKIERLNRHGQMSMEFKKESATDWRKLGLGAMREQILEETIELLNLGLRLDMKKTKRPHSFQKRKFYVPIEQLMEEGATDIFKTYPIWQTHLTELESVIQKLDDRDIYDEKHEQWTKKLVNLLSAFDVHCRVLEARQVA